MTRMSATLRMLFLNGTRRSCEKGRWMVNGEEKTTEVMMSAVMERWTNYQNKASGVKTRCCSGRPWRRIGGGGGSAPSTTMARLSE